MPPIEVCAWLLPCHNGYNLVRYNMQHIASRKCPCNPEIQVYIKDLELWVVLDDQDVVPDDLPVIIIHQKYMPIKGNPS